MKSPLLRALGLGLLFSAVSVLADTASVPVLRGVLVTGESRQFSLADANGETAWVEVGGKFSGWKVSAFDAETNALTLVRDGKETKISLAAETVQASSQPATLADAEEVIDRMRFGEMMEKMMAQQRDAMVKMTRQMIGADKMSDADAAAMAEFQGKVFDTMMKEMDLPGLQSDVAKMYAETFTKEELRGMADFYATPAGEAMIDKQPELQQRMMQLMMPRMMKAMPKIQTMSAEFAKEQTAKKAAEAPVAP